MRCFSEAPLAQHHRTDVLAPEPSGDTLRPQALRRSTPAHWQWRSNRKASLKNNKKEDGWKRWVTISGNPDSHTVTGGKGEHVAIIILALRLGTLVF